VRGIDKERQQGSKNSISARNSAPLSDVSLVEFSILKPDTSILHCALLLPNAIEHTKVIKTLSEPPRRPTSANPNARSVTRNRGGETFYSRAASADTAWLAWSAGLCS